MKPVPLRLALIPTIATFLFGFQSAVISGAVLLLKQQFGLTAWKQGFLVSIILLGALFGSLVAGRIADHWGRRRALLLLGIVLLAGTLLAACANSFSLLLVGRAVTGVGVGLSSVVVPIYLAELAPDSKRGAYVALNQLSITVGILAAFATGWLFSGGPGGGEVWRISFFLGALPAALLLLLIPICPESPRWLSRKQEVVTISFSWEELLAWRKMFLIAMVLSVLQQITGINSVIYYAPQILELAGFSAASTALAATFAIGVVNLLATLLALFLVDRWGRKPLLLTSALGMAASLALLLFPKLGTLFVLLSLFCYIISFAIGLGAVTWVVISELFPTKLRGEVVAIGFCLNWLANYLIALLFLPLVQQIGLTGVFALFAAISLAGALFIAICIPETKGKPLDQS